MKQVIDREIARAIYQGGYYAGIGHALMQGGRGRLTVEQVHEVAVRIAEDRFDDPLFREEIDAMFERKGLTLIDSPAEGEELTHVLVDVTGLNHEWLRSYDEHHANKTGPMAQTVKRVGRALNDHMNSTTEGNTP